MFLVFFYIVLYRAHISKIFGKNWYDNRTIETFKRPSEILFDSIQSNTFHVQKKNCCPLAVKPVPLNITHCKLNNSIYKENNEYSVTK